jgi:hypothetical protein
LPKGQPLTRAAFTLASILLAIELLRQFCEFSALALECKWPIWEATWFCLKFTGNFSHMFLGKAGIPFKNILLVTELVAQRYFVCLYLCLF